MTSMGEDLPFGRVTKAGTSDGIGGLFVEAWDNERFVARTLTQDDGRFAVSVAENILNEIFGDRPRAFTVKVVAREDVLNPGARWEPGAGALTFEVEYEAATPRPRLLPTEDNPDPGRELTVRAADNPLPNGTLGIIGAAVKVAGPAEFATTLLQLPYAPSQARGVDPRTARLFRWDEAASTLRPVWNSGVNVLHGFTWAKIRRPGVYVTVGLPSDPLLLSAIAAMAYRRRCTDLDSPAGHEAVTRAGFAPLTGPSAEAVDRLRVAATQLAASTSMALPRKDVQRGRAGHPRGMVLPGGLDLAGLRDRLAALETPPGGLPEEWLFYPPEAAGAESPTRAAGGGVYKRELLPKTEELDLGEWDDLDHWWSWLFDRDWWMYQGDRRHTGRARGWSNIRSTNVAGMVALPPTPVAGPVYTKPSVVDGKIYVGSTETGVGGTLYKIDLYTGVIEGAFATPILPATYSIRGVGGSPAVVGNRVYFTSIHGRVYCLDTTTMTTGTPPPPLWVTNLKHHDLQHNQPLDNSDADCWSGPLVVGDRVYVGCGEGETADASGFVYCLDADSGDVVWLFCTNQFQSGVANQPNVVPDTLVPPAITLPPQFTVFNVPANWVRGASVWSSLAYCEAYHRVYVGTGNPSPDSPAPDALYSSGCLSLDARTGHFKGFWSPTAPESYWPSDNDIDVPGGPIVYRAGRHWRVAIGSKSGAFVILDADTMAVVAFRQILPRQNGDGTPASPGTSLPSVVPFAGFPMENHYGVYGTPAHSAGRLFVSMGSDDGIPAIPDGLGDPHKTPFMRVMHDRDRGAAHALQDAWPTATDAFGITRYSNAGPPMYTTAETGLGSAAVVNNVVFACTGLGFGGAPASIYAFDVDTGLPLWGDHTPQDDYCLGAAVYGNYVVIGAGATVQRYHLP